MSKVKQVLVVRKDLNMRKGKIGAQCAHASLGAILKLMDVSSDDSGLSTYTHKITYLKGSPLDQWLNGSFTKICVYVNSEKELIELKNKAEEKYINTCLITDSGQTEFNGVPTNTVLAIGPYLSDELDQITGHLPLY